MALRKAQSVPVSSDDRQTAEQYRDKARVDGWTVDPDNLGDNKVRGTLGEIAFRTFLDRLGIEDYEWTEDGDVYDFEVFGERIDVKTRDYGQIPEYVDTPDLFFSYPQHQSHRGEVDWYALVCLSEDWTEADMIGAIRFGKAIVRGNDHPKFGTSVLVDSEDLVDIETVWESIK